MRTLQVTGHVVADAERKMTKNGKEYIAFRIGNNEYNDEKDANGKQRTYWIRVTSFNQRHFGMAQYLTKGKSVIIVGDYSDEIYQNKEGVCDISREIMANAIYFNSTGERPTNGESTSNANASIPSTQTKMEQPKPSTAELKVPTPSSTEDDELPF